MYKELDMEIGNNMDESDNLLITVNNHTKKDIYFDINVTCPADIKSEIEGSSEGEVKSKKLVYKYIYFNYVGNNPGKSHINVKVTCKDSNHHVLFNGDKIINIYKFQ